MIKPIIIKNTTNSVVYIIDLHNQYIAELEEKILSDYYTISEINSSQDLKNLVSDGTLIINDGGTDLSVEDALLHITDITNFEVPKKLIDLPEVPPIEVNSLLHGIDSTSCDWIDFNQFASSGRSLVTFSFSGSHGGLKLKATPAYKILISFVFKGTNILDSPTSFKIIGKIKDSGKFGKIKIYDYTNNNNICELYIDSTNKQIWSTTNINNLPTEEAIFEIQGLSNSDLSIESISF